MTMRFSSPKFRCDQLFSLGKTYIKHAHGKGWSGMMFRDFLCRICPKLQVFKCSRGDGGSELLFENTFDCVMYCFYNRLKALEFRMLHCSYTYISSCFDDSSLGVLLIGLWSYVSKKAHGVFACLDRMLNMPSEVLESFLNLFRCADIAMGEVDIRSVGSQQIGPFQQMGSGSQHFNGNCIFSEESSNMETSKVLDKGLMEYGYGSFPVCKVGIVACHYTGLIRCALSSDVCTTGEGNNINVDYKHRHDMPRHEIKQVICSLCGTEQEVQQVCINCGVCMGKYFCETCKLFDDDASKKQYHCDGCGICRIGGRENFFHCYKCGCCYSILLKNSHPCVEGAMHHDCPVCFESIKLVTVTDMLALFARSRFVICPRFGSFAMIVESPQKCNTMW
ncbi:unnamed protein product [Dovyalis caffra]|uniref:CTCHY-type domain-containing protein n=1 Tax=Dovyalis caffra TaxID=77055 RepID=A0AAV1SLQ5_9ROSI|nr:unnamed protein product [Dovyalis caffra]